MRTISLCWLLFYSTGTIQAQVPAKVIQSISTPGSINSHAGVLHFRDGIPDKTSIGRIYDELDRIRGIESYLYGLPGASQYAIWKGFQANGIKDNDVLVFSKLMDSRSLFLTANTDTYYFWSFVNLSNGPIVVETPPGVLGIFDDMWWRWIGDFGVPGQDRGMGGRYLLVPEGYNGKLPEGGYSVLHSRTQRVALLGRAFIDEKPIAEIDALVKRTLKIYPYKTGGVGSSIGAFLNGTGPLGQLAEATSPRFVEGSGMALNTIPPNDYSFYEMLHELVEAEPPTALDPEIAGHFYEIGIVRGKPFKPDERMKRILTESVNFANAAARTISCSARESEQFSYYGPASAWVNSLFVGGYEFITPPPDITREGPKPYPYDGARKLNGRVSMFYVATGITPAMCMRLTGIGSQYLAAFYDSQKKPFEGQKTYKLTLPPKIPAAKFWSVMLYDYQTRSMLQTAQLYPRAGSQSYPSEATTPNADGSVTIWFAPKQPKGVTRGNWIETVPGKGWWPMLRLYSPLQSFFDKTWRPGEIEESK